VAKTRQRYIKVAVKAPTPEVSVEQIAGNTGPNAQARYGNRNQFCLMDIDALSDVRPLQTFRTSDRLSRSACQLVVYAKLSNRRRVFHSRWPMLSVHDVSITTAGDHAGTCFDPWLDLLKRAPRCINSSTEACGTARQTAHRRSTFWHGTG
jgi:hypothetical protein